MAYLNYLVNHWVDNPLILLAAIYTISKLYASIFDINPKNEFNIKNILNSAKDQSGISSFLTPITACLAFLYNFGYNIIWFIGELIGWIVKISMWVYEQVIKAGLFLIIRVLWHYIVMWPWKLLLLSISLLRPSLNKRDYIIAFKGLSAALFISFLGGFINFYWELGTIVSLVFVLLSIFPLGWASGKISNPAESADENKQNTTKYFKHAFGLLLIFAGFVIIQALLVSIGSSTSMAYALSALMIGPSIISSAFIILNALLLIFILSALPSFSRNFNGSYRELYSEFGKHIYQKGLRYLIAIPTMIIPVILLILAPYYLAKGLSFTSQNIAQERYNSKLNSIQSELEKANVSNYNEWYDISTINNDSLQKLMDADKNTLSLKGELERTQINRDYINSIYSLNNSQYAAAPIGLGVVLFKEYSQWSKDKVSVSAYPDAHNDSMAFVAELEESKSRSALAQSRIPTSETPKTEAIAKDTINGDSSIANAQVIDSTTAATVATNDTSVTNTPQATNTKEKDELARCKAIEAHISSMKDQLSSMQKSMKFAAALGYLLSGFWICLLVAAAYGLGFVLFAKVNHSIYSEIDENNDWKIVSEINAAKANNPNQPILGLGILLAISILYLGDGSSFNPKNWDLGLLKTPTGPTESVEVQSDSAVIDSTIQPEITEPAAMPEEVPVVIDSISYNSDMSGYSGE